MIFSPVLSALHTLVVWHQVQLLTAQQLVCYFPAQTSCHQDCV